jgi:hypothetical protein
MAAHATAAAMLTCLGIVTRTRPGHRNFAGRKGERELTCVAVYTAAGLD